MTVLYAIVVAAGLVILGVGMIVATYRNHNWVDRVIKQILDEHDRS